MSFPGSLTVAKPADMEGLFSHRSQITYWRGKLTTDQYLERTRRIFRHPFGRERVRSLVLQDSQGDVCASMDILTVTFLVQEQAALKEHSVPLITSLVTPVSKRGKGYASLLISEYEKSAPSPIFFLYSDIGSDFYERLGYSAFPLTEVIEAARARPATPIAPVTPLTPVTIDTLIDSARAQCRDRVAQAPHSAVCLPDARFLDWHVERYRCFAEFAGRSLPEHLYWKTHGHVVAGAPDFIASQFDCLWLTPGCASCVQFAHGLAKASGCETVRYWTSQDCMPRNSQDCIPMLKTSALASGIQLLTPQIGTWF